MAKTAPPAALAGGAQFTANARQCPAETFDKPAQFVVK